MRKILITLGTIFIALSAGVYALSLQSGGFFGPATTQSSTQINTQAEKVSILQEKQASTQSQISDLERQTKVLESEVLDLERNETRLGSTIAELNEQLSENSKALNSRTTPPNNLKNLQKKQEELELIVSQTDEELISTKTNLNLSRANIDANNQSLEEVEVKLQQINEDLSAETKTLRQEVFILGVGIARYILIVIMYWILYQITRILIRRYIQNDSTKDLTTFILTIFTFLLSGATLILAFIGNLTLLVTSFGVLSAAMVVALQDLVSSFFAWILIRANGPYKRQDVIEIPFNEKTVTGIVTRVGILRTELKEKVGGSSLDREELTGKHILFPNNLILKQSLRNLTRDNKTLWHHLDLIITFESDHKRAKQIVQQIMEDIYKYMLDHHDQYLDNSYNYKTVYEPKVYISIAGDGPRITIWYAARAGMLREILEKISEQVLEEFTAHGIDLAYRTSRVIPTGDFDKPPKFIEGDS